MTRAVLKWSTITFGALSLVLTVYGFSGSAPYSLEGRILPEHIREEPKYITINAEKILNGTTVPANTNVFIQIPEEITRITRRTLFGRSGDTIRYWGYCLPHTEEEAYQNTRRNGFPGDLFLSEAEREFRRQRLIEQRRRTQSIFERITFDEYEDSRSEPRSRIRHQKEVFEGGTVCFVMTEKSIPVGSDMDDDILNAALERSFGSDPNNPDTDGDGILDGFEVLVGTVTHPTKRDSDGDGIIDGIEDANRNGKYDVGETNPTEWDTDRDGLCDGLCKVNKGQDLRGEDKNLNGIVDEGEYDPRSKDTDGDGVLDDHEVYLCVIGGGDDC